MRTWWHPLLANMLRWQLGRHYEVQEEVPVGKKPLQIDLLLLHREQGELPQTVRRILADTPPEERLEGLSAEERIKGLSAEERLKGLPAEERLKGLPAEERLRGLSREELEYLQQLLQKQTRTNSSPPPTESKTN